MTKVPMHVVRELQNMLVMAGFELWANYAFSTQAVLEAPKHLTRQFGKVWAHRGTRDHTVTTQFDAGVLEVLSPVSRFGGREADHEAVVAIVNHIKEKHGC